MSGIIVPSRLKDKLDENWSVIFHQFLHNTEGIFSSSPYFFPEYTRHDILHINHVLKIMDRLIHNATMEKLTPAATGVLLMAAISHDIGMFLKPDGLKGLLKHREWSYRWTEYGVSLQHFSGEEIKACFGVRTESDRLVLPHDFDHLTAWQIRICGEFLRRNHPLLAQDIIENGFYGYETVNLMEGIVLHSKERYCALIALIARSHGMSLDDTEPILKKLDDRKPEFALQIPVYYLMILLRLADYLDAGADRAPHVIASMQHFESAISLEEFRWNEIVELKDVWGSSGDESEFIEVDTDKIDSRTFLKVESWLKGLQRELDICWRYLALKYENKYQARYLLTIRSIDSNVLQNMPRQILEERIVIESAAIRVNPQITDLLVVPLYGDDPSYGVRELLQNALDACRERKVLEQERGNNGYEGSVIIEVNSKSNPPYFCITDNGIGMTKDVILNYFLIAGSSYRNNSSWKKSFQEKEVCRSGRFGVGVLAAFLLGYKIQVETLPMGEEKAYFYQIENNSYGQINIERKEPRTETLLHNGGGTRILIEMDSKKADRMVSEIPLDHMAVTRLDTQLLWFEWYMLDSPKLHYTIDDKKYENKELIDHLFLKWQRERGWYELPCTSAFTKVYWAPCIVHNSVSQPTVVCCNGIVIESNVLWEGIKMDFDLPLQPVSLSVMDNENAADLNLTRTKLQSVPESLNQSLYLECCKLAVALLVIMNLDYKDYMNPYFREESMIFGSKGYSIAMRRLWKSLAEKTLWEIRLSGYPVHYDELQEFCNNEIVCNIIRPYNMHEHSVMPHNAVFGELSFRPIPNCAPPEPKGKGNTIFMDDKKAYFIPDNIETIPEVEDVLSDLLGQEVWIPYDLAERKKKFPWFFNPNDRRFLYAQRASKEECTYDLNKIL